MVRVAQDVAPGFYYILTYTVPKERSSILTAFLNILIEINKFPP